MQALIHSRKFWIMVIDLVVSLVLHYAGKMSPALLGETQYLIAVLQPVFVAVIGGIAWEDAAAKSASPEAPSDTDKAA